MFKKIIMLLAAFFYVNAFNCYGVDEIWVTKKSSDGKEQKYKQVNRGQEEKEVSDLVLLDHDMRETGNNISLRCSEVIDISKDEMVNSYIMNVGEQEVMLIKHQDFIREIILLSNYYKTVMQSSEESPEEILPLFVSPVDNEEEEFELLYVDKIDKLDTNQQPTGDDSHPCYLAFEGVSNLFDGRYSLVCNLAENPPWYMQIQKMAEKTPADSSGESETKREVLEVKDTFTLDKRDSYESEDDDEEEDDDEDESNRREDSENIESPNADDQDVSGSDGSNGSKSDDNDDLTENSHIPDSQGYQNPEVLVPDTPEGEQGAEMYNEENENEPAIAETPTGSQHTPSPEGDYEPPEKTTKIE